MGVVYFDYCCVIHLNQVILLCLPFHTTHSWQLFDAAVLKTLGLILLYTQTNTYTHTHMYISCSLLIKYICPVYLDVSSSVVVLMYMLLMFAYKI